MESLLKFLEAIHSLPPELRKYLELCVKNRTLKKKDFLIKAGRICDKVYFIERGLVRSYYHEDRKEISCWFMKEGEVVIVDNFCRQRPSRENIQALEDSDFYYVTYNQLQFLYRNFTEFNVVGRRLTENHYGAVSNYIYNTKMKAAADRYIYFQDFFPGLMNRIPSNLVASFLDMSPVWLSRIRAKARLLQLIWL